MWWQIQQQATEKQAASEKLTTRRLSNSCSLLKHGFTGSLLKCNRWKRLHPPGSCEQTRSVECVLFIVQPGPSKSSDAGKGKMRQFPSSSSVTESRAAAATYSQTRGSALSTEPCGPGGSIFRVHHSQLTPAVTCSPKRRTFNFKIYKPMLVDMICKFLEDNCGTRISTENTLLREQLKQTRWKWSWYHHHFLRGLSPAPHSELARFLWPVCWHRRWGKRSARLALALLHAVLVMVALSVLVLFCFIAFKINYFWICEFWKVREQQG